MTKQRQKSIGITASEKEGLEKAKQRYEKETGEKTDWGKFLAVVSALGLGALGIYKLAKSSKSNPVVECPECGNKFVIAFSGSIPPIVQVQCPECSEEVVIDLRE